RRCLGLEECCERLTIGHDRGEICALRGDTFLRFCEGPCVDTAIGAPVAAMESHCQRPLGEQYVEPYEMPLFVRHGKRRHRLPRFRRSFTRVISLQPSHQSIHGLLIPGIQVSRGGTESVEPFAQRCIHGAAIKEGLSYPAECRSWHGLAPLPPALSDPSRLN